MKSVHYELTSKYNGEEEAPVSMTNGKLILAVARGRKSDPRYSEVHLTKVTITTEEVEIPVVPVEE